MGAKGGHVRAKRIRLPDQADSSSPTDQQGFHAKARRWQEKLFADYFSAPSGFHIFAQMLFLHVV